MDFPIRLCFPFRIIVSPLPTTIFYLLYAGGWSYVQYSMHPRASCRDSRCLSARAQFHCTNRLIVLRVECTSSDILRRAYRSRCIPGRKGHYHSRHWPFRAILVALGCGAQKTPHPGTLTPTKRRHLVEPGSTILTYSSQLNVGAGSPKKCRVSDLLHLHLATVTAILLCPPPLSGQISPTGYSVENTIPHVHGLVASAASTYPCPYPIHYPARIFFNCRRGGFKCPSFCPTRRVLVARSIRPSPDKSTVCTI